MRWNEIGSEHRRFDRNGLLTEHDMLVLAGLFHSASTLLLLRLLNLHPHWFDY
jgi:hypothetical protein